MVALFRSGRKHAARLIAALSLVALAACDGTTSVGGGGPSIDTTRAVPVALLVPQSGSTALLARDLENAARMAIADLNGAKIDLRVYDTAGTPAGATSAANRAAQDGAKIVVGPLFADTSAAAGAALRGRNINVLSFSNNPAIAGGNVFILGPTFQSAANRLAGFASRRGVASAAIVYGQSPAEEIGRNAIASALRSSGVQLATEASFPLSQNGVIAAMPGIATQIENSGADAVFLTSGVDGAIPFLSQMLPENGISPSSYQYIGLQRFDSTGSALSLSGLQGSWFAVPSPAISGQFAARYAGTYGAQPSAPAGLAYDAIAAVGALVSAGDANALKGSALTRGSGFVGANGVFRFLPNGTNDRALAVATIENKQVVILEPAPRSFAGAGF